MFCIGLYGVLARRSAVLILMAIELMLNAVNVNLVAFAAYRVEDPATGLVIAIFVITIAAAEVALALGIIAGCFGMIVLRGKAACWNEHEEQSAQGRPSATIAQI